MCLGMAWPQKKFDHWKDNKEYDFFNSKGDLDLLFFDVWFSSMSLLTLLLFWL